jgi:glycosyltransferase involved in cell wall biosynthesis
MFGKSMANVTVTNEASGTNIYEIADEIYKPSFEKGEVAETCMSYRTLVIAPTLPYPASNGGDLRNWQNVAGLSRISAVGVFGLRSNDPNCAKNPPQRLEFWRSSTDLMLTDPGPNQPLAARAWVLDPFGHPSDLYYSGTAASQLADLMVSFKPDIVIIEGLWLHRYIATVRRFHCRVVLDCHNVEAALIQEIANATEGNELPARLIRKFLPSRTKMIEQPAVQAVDQIWVCSDNDAQLMKKLYGETTVSCVVPNAVDVARYDKESACYPKPPEGINHNGKVVIFPAAFAWAPNTVAASFLINEIFPRLAADIPDAQLVLPGNRPTAEMTNAAQKEPRILVTGAVPDIRPYLAAASCMLVPLFQGSGTRFKILESFAAKVPVISTAKGAEGLTVENGKHLLLAESADEFVGAVKRLWTDRCLADELASNGLELVKQSYSFAAVNRMIANAINELGLEG